MTFNLKANIYFTFKLLSHMRYMPLKEFFRQPVDTDFGVTLFSVFFVKFIFREKLDMFWNKTKNTIHQSSKTKI